MSGFSTFAIESQPAPAKAAETTPANTPDKPTATPAADTGTTAPTQAAVTPPPDAVIAEARRIMTTDWARYQQEGWSDKLAAALNSRGAGEDDGDDLSVDLDDEADTDDEPAAEGQEGEAAAAEPAQADAEPQFDPDDFEYAPPAGTEITEQGHARIGAFAEVASKSGMTQDQTTQLLDWYNNDFTKAEQARLAEADKAHVRERRDALTRVWGNYDANAAIVEQAARSLPKPLLKAFKTARTPDGRLIANMPELAQLLHQVGRNTTPVNDAADDAKTEETARMIMKNDFPRYINEGWDRKLTAIIERRGGT